MSETVNLDNYCGVYREYHDKDKTEIKSEVFMNNGKKEDPYELYHKNGKLYGEINYINDAEVNRNKSILNYFFIYFFSILCFSFSISLIFILL